MLKLLQRTNQTEELLGKLIDIASKQITENFVLTRRLEALEHKVAMLENKLERLQGSVIVVTEDELQKWAQSGTD